MRVCLVSRTNTQGLVSSLTIAVNGEFGVAFDADHLAGTMPFVLRYRGGKVFPIHE